MGEQHIRVRAPNEQTPEDRYLRDRESYAQSTLEEAVDLENRA